MRQIRLYMPLKFDILHGKKLIKHNYSTLSCQCGTLHILNIFIFVCICFCMCTKCCAQSDSVSP